MGEPPSKRARHNSESFQLTTERLTDLGYDFFEEHKLSWREDMDTILIMTKAEDNKLVKDTRQLTEWLVTTSRFGKSYPFTVYVDAHLEHSKRFGYRKMLEKDPTAAKKIKFWTPKLCYKNPSLFHLIIILGGDGTVLFTSWLFQTQVPPIIPFHLGSLSFLTPFPFSNHRQALENLFNSNGDDDNGSGLRTTLRMRLSCTIYRYRNDCENTRRAKQCAKTGALWTSRKRNDNVKGHDEDAKDIDGGWELLETAWMKQHLNEVPAAQEEATRDDNGRQDIPCYTTVSSETFQVLNELVVDRGPCAYMSSLELFGNERHLTTVQADGLVIATPTGSTAYSLSAYGSLCHPCVPSILITPICAHTLNFRPMLVPHTMTIRIVVPFGSRSPAYCSFDGRNRVELQRGDHGKITISPYAMSTICNVDTDNDWFQSLESCLLWNTRVKQKSFVVVESAADKQQLQSTTTTLEENQMSAEQEQQQRQQGHAGKDKIFACIEKQKQQREHGSTGDNGKSTKPSKAQKSISTEDMEDEEEDEEGFDLVPWTAEELSRD